MTRDAFLGISGDDALIGASGNDSPKAPTRPEYKQRASVTCRVTGNRLLKISTHR
jgi:hypothetical protein